MYAPKGKRENLVFRLSAFALFALVFAYTFGAMRFLTKRLDAASGTGLQPPDEVVTFNFKLVERLVAQGVLPMPPP